MSYAEAAPRRARFQIGEALQATFDAVFANLRVFASLALVLVVAPTFVVQAAFGPPGAIASPGLAAAGGIVRAVVGLACSALLQGALVRGVIIHLNGRRPGFAECLRSGLSAAAPLAAIGLIFGLAVGFGLVFLLVPGLFLIALWAVAAPVAVVERAGVFGSFSRSAALTAGHRWGVLGTLVLMGIIGLVAVILASAVVGLITGVGVAAGVGGAARIGVTMGWGAFTIAAAIGALLNGLAAIFTNAAPAAIYYELRRTKEGAAPATLAAVFD